MKYVLIDSNNKVAKVLKSTPEFADREAQVFNLTVLPVDDAVEIPDNAVRVNGAFKSVAPAADGLVLKRDVPTKNPFAEIADVKAWVDANVNSISDAKKVLASLITLALRR